MLYQIKRVSDNWADVLTTDFAFGLGLFLLLAAFGRDNNVFKIGLYRFRFKKNIPIHVAARFV